MPLQGEHLGMTLTVSDLDTENLGYFGHCGQHDFRLQRCCACGLLRYPPTTACPFCSSPDADWTPVEGRGEVHSYTEVHHAIQPAFKAQAPYQVLLVELDTQKGEPGPNEALRIVGNLVEPDGTLAEPDTVAKVGIGSRVRMVFNDVGPGFAIPQWVLDEDESQLARPWRYAES